DRFVKGTAVVRCVSPAPAVRDVGRGQTRVISAQATIGIGEHPKPVMARRLRYPQLETVITASSGNQVCRRTHSGIWVADLRHASSQHRIAEVRARGGVR